ncbi:hypothetical protein [Marinicella meishanensis]|uniref:hypothetical protein n=1 Tax=Marinicella meishanensis TaxID=2873263 RepID=UPI001CBB4664|nr:hypothetical protein [Marinicella sp. NBU2979]
MKRWALYLVMVCGVGLAQEDDWVVTTFSEARANGDIFVADNGDVFINDFGIPSAGNGTTMVKITPDGQASVFASGLSFAPSGIVMDASGDLYAATFNGGDVYRISANGSPTVVNSGLAGPVGLAVDDNNNLYVAECSANRISRLVGGSAQTVGFIQGGCANGLVWGHDQALYVLAWQTGNIFRMDLSGNVSLFATIPGGGGHLELSGDHYYVLGRTAHKVYRVDFAGNVTTYAGTGIDGQGDGPLLEATFSRPNGIGVHRPTGELYVTGTSLQTFVPIPIRKIAPDTSVPSNDFLINAGLAGSWVDPAASAQGVVLDIILTDGQPDAVLFWFTHNDQAADPDTELDGFGSRQNRWFTASGSANGAVLEMPIFRSSGGQFNLDVPVTTEAVGSLRLEFFSCFEARLDYEFDAPGAPSGGMDLQRITPDIWCESLLAE